MAFNAIGLSGDPCSGKTVLIRELERVLGWEVLSIGGLFRKRFITWQADLPSLRNTADFDEWWANRVSDRDIRQVNREARERLERGEVILDSRYVAVNAQDFPTVARIYLTAPLEVRGQRALISGRYPGLSLRGDGGAMDKLHRRALEEYKKGTDLFKIDYRDPTAYHLILNTGMLSLDQEISQVLHLIGKS